MTKTMSHCAAMEYQPRHPITFREWPNRTSMLKTLELQDKREHRQGDWSECKSDYLKGSMRLREVAA